MAVPLVTLAQVRAEGLLAADADDASVNAAIQLASDYVEMVTQMAFSVQTFLAAAPLRVDGTGHDTLWLYVPILGVTAAGEVLDTSTGTPPVAGITLTTYLSTTYIVYNRRGVGRMDDRRNPKIVRRNGIWPQGKLNIYLTGTFAWLDDDGAGADIVPRPIQEVVLGLVINDFVWLLTDEYRQRERLRRWVKNEKTEGHSYSLADVAFSGGPSGIGWIDRILRRYTRTLHVRA